MNRVHLEAIPWDELRSPHGKFHSFCRNVSLALGGIRHTGTWGGGQPFDVQIRRIPPGAAVCPFHLHLAQWELFLVRAGHGTVRAGAETHAVAPGDVFVHPPGEPHQLTNSGDADLEVLIIADNPVLDACYYPDSNKWAMRPPGKFFRMAETDYPDGEEAAAPGQSGYRPSPPPAAPPLSPFPARKRHLDDVPWYPWSSPKGKFRAEGKGLSLALGAQPRTPPALGGHPFDLELGQVRPGDTPCPFHSHAAQWELYLFTEGRGSFRWNDERADVGPGDVIMAAPGVAHTFTNTGDRDLLDDLVADDPLVEVWHYPDSNKSGFNAPRKFFRPVEVDYFDGEE